MQEQPTAKKASQSHLQSRKGGFVAGRGAPVGSHKQRDTGSTWEPKQRRLQSASQPHYITGNVMYHFHIKMYAINVTTETVLYIPTTAFLK